MWGANVSLESLSKYPIIYQDWLKGIFLVSLPPSTDRQNMLQMLSLGWLQ